MADIESGYGEFVTPYGYDGSEEIGDGGDHYPVDGDALASPDILPTDDRINDAADAAPDVRDMLEEAAAPAAGAVALSDVSVEADIEDRGMTHEGVHRRFLPGEALDKVKQVYGILSASLSDEEMREIITAPQSSALQRISDASSIEEVGALMHYADTTSAHRVVRTIFTRFAGNDRVRELVPERLLEPEGPDIPETSENPPAGRGVTATREGLGLTQAEAAALAGITVGTLRRLEIGGSFPHGRTVADYLHAWGAGEQAVAKVMGPYEAERAHVLAERADARNQEDGAAESQSRAFLQGLASSGVDASQFFSRRQQSLREVYDLIVQGVPVAEIAKTMRVSMTTVYTHTGRIVRIIADMRPGLVPPEVVRPKAPPVPADTTIVGGRLRTMREGQTITRKVIAERIGIDESTLGRLETGRNRPARWVVEAYLREVAAPDDLSAAELANYEDELHQSHRRKK